MKFKYYQLLFVAFMLIGCGDTTSGTTPENNTQTAGCKKVGDPGAELQICTLAQPIQETGFQCPEGTPYLFEYDEGAVCSSNPELGDDDALVVRDEGLAECTSEMTAFCGAATAPQARLDNCADWTNFECLTQDERTALISACNAAAIGASDSDWSVIGSCNEISNGSSDGNDDLCVDISGCVSRELRVCNQNNDECFSLRSGRLRTCDRLIGENTSCLPEDEREPLLAMCETYVDEATEAEFQELPNCIDIANNSFELGGDICDDRIGCVRDLFSNEL